MFCRKGERSGRSVGEIKKVPAVKIVDVEVVASTHEEEFRTWAEEAERELDVLQGKRQSK